MGEIVPRRIPRVVLAGTGSGCGKTTVTCGVLGALQRRGIGLRSFKCGPDYIDPMFHTKVMDIPSRNLDSFLCSEDTVRGLFSRNVPENSIAVVEGVMGLYDGLSGTNTTASTYHIARLLDAPVVLICSCKGKSLSLAAELRGYRDFLPGSIAGVILNGISPSTYAMYKNIVEEHAGLEVLGYLPHIPEAVLHSRHLGLITAGEVVGLREKLEHLARQAESTVALDRLLEIAHASPPFSAAELTAPPYAGRVRVAVARDNAFCFYYQDSLDLLEQNGAKLIPFSPLADADLPEDCDGLLLGGGYPELYAETLAQNVPILRAVGRAVKSGMPTIAECGGFMLLCRSLTTSGGSRYPMAGVIHTDVRMTNRLSRFGYITLTARGDNLLCRAGESIGAHSFHYSDADDPGDGFTAAKQDGRRWNTVHVSESLYAGYPHLHLWGNTGFAEKYVAACRTYANRKQG